MKCLAFVGDDGRAVSRTREGAWIEMPLLLLRQGFGDSRTREGAWIEIIAYIISYVATIVAPVRVRGLKSERF